LVDWGYHINHRAFEDSKDFDAPYQFRGFEKYKITSIFKEKLKISLEVDNKALGKTGSKSSTAEPASRKDAFVHVYKFLYPKRYCHTTIEPFFDLEMSYLSKGWGAFKIMSFMEQLREGGFFRYWETRDNHILKCASKSSFRNPELEAPKVSPTPLKGKIRHIFQIYGIGNCLAVSWFMGKFIQVYVSNNVKITSVFCSVKWKCSV